MSPPNDKAVSWQTKSDVAAPDWQPDARSAAAPDPDIEVFDADDLLGIGLGADFWAGLGERASLRERASLGKGGRLGAQANQREQVGLR